MKKSIVILFTLFALYAPINFCQDTDVPVISMPLDRNDNLPEGWFKSGTQPQDYSIGIDRSMSSNGNASAYIRSKEMKPSGSCLLAQEIKAENYRGERVSLSGYVKTKYVSYWSGLFMIAYDAAGRAIAYDNMQNRPVVGSSEWIKYEIVLDIPQNSDKIFFGASLNGKGEIWIDNLKLLVVSKNVPVTDLSGKLPDALYPENMDFEK
jgi:hypothetical protein